MSRRKQAKPRALKREMEEDTGENVDASISMVTDLHVKDTSSNPQTADATGDEKMVTVTQAPPSSTVTDADPEDEATGSGSDVTMSFHDVTAPAPSPLPADQEKDEESDKAGREGEEEEEELETEEYRCDVCNDTFHSLTHFMDHRNFECVPDGDGSWRRNVSPNTSRTSSPCSFDGGKSPLTLSDSPLSPTAAEIPLEQLPFALGVNESHPYACQFCEKAFSRLSFLKKHEQVHSDQMPFRCEFCHRLFKHKRSRDRHVKLHTGDRKYRCPHCHAAFSRSDHLKIHLRTHDNAKPFQCTACNRGFTTSAALTSHTLTHKKTQTNGELSYKCGICNEKFTSEADLQMHVIGHELPSSPGKTDKVYQCEKCQEICLGRSSLDLHMKEAHREGVLGNETSICPLCKATFTDSENFFMHLKSHAKMGKLSDGEETKMSPSSAKKRKVSADDRQDCPYCNQGGFICLDSLEAHIRIAHAGMHVCQFCNAAYPTMTDLDEHIKIIHHKAIAVKQACDFCNMEFRHMSELTSHLAKAHKFIDSRSTDKPTNAYLCQYCNASYPNITNLEDHIKIIHHTSLGIKFSCEYCTSEFNELPDLKDHLEKAHKYADIAGTKDHLDLHFCAHCTMGFPDAFALSEHVHNVHFSTIAIKNGQESPGLVIKTEKHSRPPSASSLNNTKMYRESFGSPSSHSDKGSHPSRPNSSASTGNPAIISCTNGDLVCDQCNATFLDSKSYTVHMNSHASSGNSKYSCAECASEFTSEEQLENHVFVHFLALTTEYGCTSCLKLFTKPDELQKHLMDIHAHHLYRCSLCKEIFDSKVNIQVHFAIKHSNECKLYKCMPCGSVFRSEMEWQLHVKVHHLGMSKPYRCLFCKEAFSTEVELQCHLTTHKKQFPCPLCDEAFHVEYLLDKHMQTKHSPDEPGTAVIKPKQECESEIIDYSISSNSSTTAVTTTTTPVKNTKIQIPELSPQCHRSVTVVPQPMVSPIPSNHSASVTPPLMRKGELNYRCDICDVKFSEDATLQKHRLHDHSISPEMNVALQKAKAAAAVAKQQQQSQQQQTQVSPKSNQSGGTDKFSQLCVYCNKTFKTKSELEKHMKTHVTPSNQKCNICDEIFPSASILAEHKLTHCKVVKGNICVVCKVAMKNEEQFYAHAQQHGFQGTNMQCIVCRQTLASMLELQMHGKHHFQNPASFYTCCVCLGSFDSKENLISKLNSSGRAYYVCKPCYHGELANEFRCTTCNVKFETQGALDTHMTNHKKTYQCIKCQQSFASEYEIQVHVATHVMQEGNVHDCKICGTVFDSPAKLQCHLIEHTFETTEIRCYICNSLFTHASAIQMHVLEHGLGARRYACTHCPQSFFFTAELQNHILSAHNDGLTLSPSPVVPKMELQCPMCPKTFTSLLALGSHRKTHDKKSPSPMPTSSSSSSSGEETLKCSLCPETFPNLGDLQHHFLSSHAADAELLQHKGAFSMVALDHTTGPSSGGAGSLQGLTTGRVKSIQCSECGKECSSLAHLQSHSKIHSSGKENRKNLQKAPPPNKPLPCPICGRTFTRKTHLKDHMKVHLQNVQPASYSCEFCHDMFVSTKLLRRHLVNVHHTNSPSPEHHPPPAPYTNHHTCRVCSDTFPQRRHLLAHLQQVHGVVMAIKNEEVAMETNEDENHSEASVLEEENGEGISPMSASSQERISRLLSREISVRSGNNNGRTTPTCNLDGVNGEREVQFVNKNSEQNNKFVGVTVVANPSEQVTVS